MVQAELIESTQEHPENVMPKTIPVQNENHRESLKGLNQIHESSMQDELDAIASVVRKT